MGARLLSAWRRVWRELTAVAFGCGIVAASPAVLLAGAEPVTVRFGGDQTATRVVLDLDRAVQGKLVSGGDGARDLVLDFPKLSVDGLDGQGRGLVGAWTLERTVTGARLKLALSKGAVVEKRFLLAPSEGAATYRYVIDLRASGSAAALTPAPRPAVASTRVAPVAVERVSTSSAPLAARPAKAGRKTIVIDAGHGGRDSGALGATAREKDMTLATAKALKAQLEKTGRYRVVMTRDSDTYVPLETRVRISRNAGANLFISLHADAGANKETRGASVYTISDRGSSVAARKQSGDGFLNIALPGGTKAVRDILFDLTQRSTRNKSGAFADILINKVSGHAPLLTRAHRDAGFMVLLAPDVPSVLFEMGFITNAQDEALLTSTSQRNKVVAGIVSAIDEYFAREVRIAAL